jgi:hypothetical protein
MLVPHCDLTPQVGATDRADDPDRRQAFGTRTRREERLAVQQHRLCESASSEAAIVPTTHSESIGTRQAPLNPSLRRQRRRCSAASPFPCGAAATRNPTRRVVHARTPLSRSSVPARGPAFRIRVDSPATAPASGRRPCALPLVGELESPASPNAGDIRTRAFWESARPGVAIGATPSVRSGPGPPNRWIALGRRANGAVTPREQPAPGGSDFRSTAVASPMAGWGCPPGEGEHAPLQPSLTVQMWRSRSRSNLSASVTGAGAASSDRETTRRSR